MDVIENCLTDVDVARPIFIGGMHRSGTTLLRVMLNRHPRICSGPETELFERTSFLDFHRYLEATWLPRLHHAYGFEARDLDRAIAGFMNNFLSRYQVQRGKERWAEKTPKNILRIDYLFRIFPHAQFLHMIRDPRDIHASVKAKSVRDSPKWAAYGAEETAWDWVQRMKRGMAWRDQAGQYRGIRYEDLVQDPEGVMRQIMAFLGEPWDQAVLEAPRSQPDADRPNVARPIFDSSMGRWQNDLLREEVRQIETIAGSLMRSMGYMPELVSEDMSLTITGNGMRER